MTNNIISIDVFDTAILRKVYRPDDIFQVIEQKVHNEFLHKRKALVIRAFLYWTIKYNFNLIVIHNYVINKIIN